MGAPAEPSPKILIIGTGELARVTESRGRRGFQCRKEAVRLSTHGGTPHLNEQPGGGAIRVLVLLVNVLVNKLQLVRNVAIVHGAALERSRRGCAREHTSEQRYRKHHTGHGT